MAKSSNRKAASQTSKPAQSKVARPRNPKPTKRGAALKTKQASVSQRLEFVAAVKASAARSRTKQAQVLAMLRATGGATIEAIISVTGWKSHSVRGFFAGVVRKKLGLDLTSEAGEGGRVYRVTDASRADATASAAKSHAAA